jgi:predicted AlkP superfamily pyrophosphatase or phosphodiesterase
MTRLIQGCAAFLLAAAYANAQQPASSAVPPAGRPSLVVLVTIDQMRPDYLDRFGAQLRGGLARLKNGGALFTNAHHDHAITETAPGHATLLSGRFPGSTGISTNSASVNDDSSALIGAPNLPGASPRRFHGTTLVDWLIAKDKRSRALSVSMKDRGAILPIGRSRQSIYWYIPDGRFTTSRYYADSLPTWVQQFNARRLPQSYAGKSWTLLLPASEYKEPDSVDFEGAGQDFVFPHMLPADSSIAASLVRDTPWMDLITAALALDGLQTLGLGKGPQTDILAVSFSATDLIGHRYGPDSREMHDNILELDRTLGVFLDSLYKLRDSSRIAVILTADHGIGSIPEIAARTVRPLPKRVELFSVLKPIRDRLAPKKLDAAIRLDQQVLWVDRAAFKAARVNADSVINLFADAARKVSGVARVDWFRSLAADTLKDPIARRWTHQFGPGDPVELVITLTPHSVWGTTTIATHGSPYDYDSHVPLVFYGPWFRTGRYDDAVRTVDIAPTLAEVTGVRPSERVDGVVLKRALK